MVLVMRKATRTAARSTGMAVGEWECSEMRERERRVINRSQNLKRTDPFELR